MNNKPFSFTDKDAVTKFFGDLNELVYGINPYEKKAAFEPAISDEEDEKEKEPLPEDDEIDAMYAASESQNYRDSH